MDYHPFLILDPTTVIDFAFKEKQLLCDPQYVCILMRKQAGKIF